MRRVSDQPAVTGALGLESGTVRIAPYDATWPTLYAAEAARLESVLEARGLSLALEHTGSTAVPGLPAKPVLDILGGLHDDADRPAAIAALVAAGYNHRGEQGIPGRDFFRRGSPRQYHLHLTRLGSEFWTEHRLFRDYLRTHPEARDAYAALKAELAERFPFDREQYIEGKTEFVLRTLAKARADAREENR